MDMEGEKTYEMRTTEEIVKAMCSLVPFLEFTGESADMFDHKRLPTLDVDLWWEGGKINHSFYEKPQVPNRVLLKGTALPESTIRASLVQEVARRIYLKGQDRVRSSKEHSKAARISKRRNEVERNSKG